MSQLAEKMEGRILQGAPSLHFKSFAIDSRQVKSGDLFFAIVAQRNGHAFVPNSAKQGAAGAVISQSIPNPDNGFGLIQVEDTLTALQKLAKKVLETHSAKVVGITGSMGKTTTKEFVSSLLSPGINVLKSEGNFNNHLGLPLSLLRLENRHEVAVLEMGMSTPGEIRALTRIAPPDVAVVTNVRPVHLQFFKGIKEIALAKQEILEGMKKGGTAVLNADDPWVRKMAEGRKVNKIYFGLSKDSNVRARNICRKGVEGMSFDFTYGKESQNILLPFFLDSFLYNFLAAAAAAFALSVSFDSILPRIKTLRPFPMRGTIFRLKRNIILVDDSYNSNPEALELALRDLGRLPAAKRIAVLGDMRELGKEEANYHVQAGKQAVRLGWDILIAVGPLGPKIAQGAVEEGLKKSKILTFENSEEAADKIWPLLKADDLILVKGSRAVKMEKIVDNLKEKGL